MLIYFFLNLSPKVMLAVLKSLGLICSCIYIIIALSTPAAFLASSI